jgi:hypothetical protein
MKPIRRDAGPPTRGTTSRPISRPGPCRSRLGRVASSAVPFTGAVRTVQQAADPVARQPRTIVDTVKAGIPGLSEQVTPRLTRFGEPTVRPGGAWRRALDPFNSSEEVDDPLARELERLEVDVPTLSDRIRLPGGYTLDADEALAFRQVQGRAMRQALEQVQQQNAAIRRCLTRSVRCCSRKRSAGSAIVRRISAARRCAAASGASVKNRRL